MSADAGAGATLGGATREHADIDASEQVQAMQLLCADIATEPDPSRRDDLGRHGYRSVLGLVQRIEQANACVRSALEAAADRNGVGQRGMHVVGVWEAARSLEMAVTVGTAVFGAFAAGITELQPKLRPRAARALNTAHLRELVAQGVGARTAAKQFLSTVLLQIPTSSSVAAAGVAVQSAGVMGQGLFATIGLAPGTVVGEYKGEVLDASGVGARYPGRTECDYVRRHYFCLFLRWTVPFIFTMVMQVAEDVWIDAVSTDQALTNHTRYLNHAEGAATNCAVFVGDVDHAGRAPKAVIFTLRQVSVGEQLLFDYGPKYWEGRADPSPPKVAHELVGGAEEEEKVIDWDQAMEELD